MDDELVLLTSYLNLANGKRQDHAETFRAETDLPSSTSPDGSAALYVVTETSAAGTLGVRVRRLVANTVAAAYTEPSEEAPHVRIRSALRKAHALVREEYEGHVTVGASVIAVEGDTVFLGQVAPAQVYVLHDGQLHSIPAAADEDSPYARALGSGSMPRVSISRDQIGANDVVALCSSWFHDALEPEHVRDCFSAGTGEEITECLMQAAKKGNARDVTAILIEAVQASELEQEPDEEYPGFMEQIDDAVQTLAGLSRMLLTELKPMPQVFETNGHTAPPRERPRRQPSPPEAGQELHEESYEDSSDAANAWEEAELEPDLRRFMDGSDSSASPVEEHEGSRPVEPPSAVAEREHATEEVPVVPPENRDIDLDQTGEIHAVRAYQSDPDLDQTGEFPIIHADSPEPTAPSETRDESAGSTPIMEDWTPSSDVEPDYRPRRRSRRAPEPPPREEQPEPPAPSELDRLNSRLQDETDLGTVIPPIQTFPDTSTQPERIYATSKDIQRVNKRPRRFGGIARPVGRDPLDEPAVVRPPISSIDLSRPTMRSAPPNVVWIGIALVFVLAIGVLLTFIRHHHTTPTNPYPALIRQNLRLASASKTPAKQDLYLSRAHKNLTLAQQTGADSAVIRQLTNRWQATSDRLHGVSRVSNPVVLANFTKLPGAQAAEIATTPGLVYVLDSGRKRVLSYSTNSTSSSPTTIVESNEVDSNFTIGTPLYITSDNATALVLDDHNTLVRYSNGTKTATTLTQPSPNEHIISMQTEDPDVYTLDTANSQIWRYPFAVTGYNPRSEGYFQPTAPDFHHAVAFAMDGTDVFVLQSDGTVDKYDNQALRQPFTAQLRTPFKHATLITTDPGLKDLWIADPATGRIIQLDKSGTYVRTYESGTHSFSFSTITSIAIGPDGNTLYVVAGNILYKFNVTQA
jgi:hypothetical protein